MLTYLDFFFFNDTATTEIYTLSLHDALPISPAPRSRRLEPAAARREVRADLSECSLLDERHGLGRVPSAGRPAPALPQRDRKSTRLNSSHDQISYAVFCLKKKNNTWPRLQHQ